MGPQFNVFGKLKKLELSEIKLYEGDKPLEKNVASFYSNPEFPAHISGLDSELFYKCNGKRMLFGAATYIEYGEFKNHLAKIAGFETAEKLWTSGVPTFFLELINFSNSVGTIGPVICQKLYSDSKDNYEIAEKYFINLDNGEKFWMHYQNWCKALHVAKQNGAILIS